MLAVDNGAVEVVCESDWQEGVRLIGGIKGTPLVAGCRDSVAERGVFLLPRMGFVVCCNQCPSWRVVNVVSLPSLGWLNNMKISS